MKRTPLRASPGKIREFNQRAQDKRRANAAMPGIVRQGLPATPPKRTRPKRPDPIPSETRAAARARSGGRCVVCVYYGHGGRGHGKATALHHVLPKQRNKWPELVAVLDNLVGICNSHHDNHEHGGARIPLLALPECVFRLAADVGPGAVDYLLKVYPESGGSPDGRT